MAMPDDGAADTDGCSDENERAADGDDVEQQHRLSEKKDNKSRWGEESGEGRK